MLTEAHRVLKPKGTYFCMSRLGENKRFPYLKKPDLFTWKIHKYMIQKPSIGPTMKLIQVPKKDDTKNFHFLYACCKKPEGDEESEDDKEAKEKT